MTKDLYSCQALQRWCHYIIESTKFYVGLVPRTAKPNFWINWRTKSYAHFKINNLIWAYSTVSFLKNASLCNIARGVVILMLQIQRELKYNLDMPLARNVLWLNGDGESEQVSEQLWWRHQMETFSALLALCAGKSPVTGEFPSQRPVTQSFDVFFDLCLNNGWVNNCEAGNLRCHRSHYDVRVMMINTCRAAFILGNAHICNI